MTGYGRILRQGKQPVPKSLSVEKRDLERASGSIPRVSPGDVLVFFLYAHNALKIIVFTDISADMKIVSTHIHNF